ncbi:lactococcin 972 family bacteriocin [Amycolatopsis sp. WAC 04182]|uniref:lactococcin 972 family bacteriocin n=1 Tax=Amycolatopsis sp. WAC 04182 TaxID=2203198 RepID=UPI0018F3273B|nr:lactococcin 972 family bacteriocin [Amycolatopsis sp. WAC 04182]
MVASLFAAAPMASADSAEGVSVVVASSGAQGVVLSGSVPFACQNISGGTWCYGTESAGSGQKKCYSHYLHPSRRHSATAILGSRQDKKVVSRGQWAKAEVIGSRNDTCNAYYNSNA